MKALLDIPGASGRAYRFRLVPAPMNLPATSGNFLFVRFEKGAPTLVCSGTSDSLIQAGEQWPQAKSEHKAAAIYVRLNLARRVRLDEHADIAALHAPPMLLAESGDVQPRAATEAEGVEPRSEPRA